MKRAVLIIAGFPAAIAIDVAIGYLAGRDDLLRQGLAENAAELKPEDAE